MSFDRKIDIEDNLVPMSITGCVNYDIGSDLWLKKDLIVSDFAVHMVNISDAIDFLKVD